MPTITPTSGHATGVGYSAVMQWRIHPTSGAATSTGTSTGRQLRVIPTSGSATGAGITADHGVGINPTSGSGTGLGYSALPDVGENPTSGQANGAGSGITVTLQAHDGKWRIQPRSAIATGAGYSAHPGLRTTPTSGNATGAARSILASFAAGSGPMTAGGTLIWEMLPSKSLTYRWHKAKSARIADGTVTATRMYWMGSPEGTLTLQATTVPLLDATQIEAQLNAAAGLVPFKTADGLTVVGIPISVKRQIKPGMAHSDLTAQVFVPG